MKRILFGTERHRGLLAYLLIFLLIGFSAGMYLYPAIRQKEASDRQAAVRITYETSVGQSGGEELAEEWERAQRYNRELRESSLSDPFLGTEEELLSEEYLSLLNVGGVMGEIEYPSLGIDLPIYHGTGEEALEKGAGHLPGTSLPVGGEDTYAVLVGHNGLPGARMFDDLEKAKIGDEFILHVLGHDLTYEVEWIRVVTPSRVEVLFSLPEADRVTLLTCTPYGENTHRLLVSGVRRETEEHDETAPSGGETVKTVSPTRDMLVTRIAVCAAVVCVLILLLVVTEVRMGRRKGAARSGRHTPTGKH